MNIEETMEGIKKLQDEPGESKIKSYSFEMTERIILRLNSFTECSECRTFIEEYTSIIQEMNRDLNIELNKKYNLLQKKALNHLQKNHKLITPRYYTNLCMACGIGIGLPLGIVFSNLLGQVAYIGFGLPIGAGIGLSIGSALDAKAKKDGLMI